MTVYDGGHVAYGAAGEWWVRVVASDPPATTAAAVTVNIRVQVVFTQSISDSSNTGSYNIGGVANSFNNFSYVSGSGTTFEVANFNISVATAYGANGTYPISATVNSLATGGTGPSSVGPGTGSNVPPRLPSPPNAPGAPTVAGITATSAGVSVSSVPANNGATITNYNYRIHRHTDNVHMGDLAGTSGGVTFTNLARATQYRAYVQAFNTAGWGAFSGFTLFTTLTAVPGAPTAVSASGITAVAATVSWTPPSDNGGTAITSYEVQYATTLGFTSPTTQATGALTGLTPGTLYYSRVRAVNARGPGAWSTPTVAFTTNTGVRLWTGTAWAQAPLYLGTTTTPVISEVRIYNGSAWVPTG